MDIPTAEEEEAIENDLRELLKAALRLRSKPRGRILIHGKVQHSIFGGFEPHRPVDFYFGSLLPACGTCIAKKASKAGVFTDDLRRLISKAWMRKLGIESDRVAPVCWKENYLCCPDLALRCCKEGRRSDFKFWTALDVLALARLRRKRWAIRKPAMLETPGQSFQADPKHIRLFTSQYFTDEKNDDIASTASFAHKRDVNEEAQKAQCRQRYATTFGCDDWDEALVWKQLSKGALKRKPEEYEYGSGDNMRSHVVRARESWSDGKPDWANQSFRALDTECCALLSRNDEPGLYVIYDCRQGEAWETFLFVEIEQDVQSALLARAKPDGGQRVRYKIESERTGSLFRFCRNRIAPFQSAIRRHDNLCLRNQAVSGLYPQGMKELLLKETNYSAVLLKEGRTETFEQKLAAIERFYIRTLSNEYDSSHPVDLALSLLRETWRVAYRDAIRPQYAEFQRFQQLLRRISAYRDHLTHSVQVFLTGNRILDSLGKDVRNSVAGSLLEAKVEGQDDLKKLRDLSKDPGGIAERVLFYQWTLASLMHDFAVPAEKANELSSHLYETFLGLSGHKAGLGEGPGPALAQEATSYKTLLYSLLTRSAGSRPQSEALLPLLGDHMYRALTEDHGFLSAVYLFNQLFEKAKTKEKKWWSLNSAVTDQFFIDVIRPTDPGSLSRLPSSESAALGKLAETVVLEVIDAIVKHNAFSKEYSIGLTDAPAFRLPAFSFGAASAPYGGVVLGLLLLCDNLCDWGRTVFPDELVGHEVGASRELGQIEVARPEGMITAIEMVSGAGTTREHLHIEVDYRWRLPFRYDTADIEPCLKKIYKQLKRENWPYTPGFRMWRKCKDCTNEGAHADECSAWNQMTRFWGQVLTSNGNDGNRLRFPEKPPGNGIQPDPKLVFNRIEVTVRFYGKHDLHVVLGTGADQGGTAE